MNLLQYYHRLWDYDQWANQEVLAGCQQAATPPRALKLLAHIIAAEMLWLNRMQNEPQKLAVWPAFSLADCEKHLAMAELQWQAFMRALTEAELGREVNYKNTKGENWRGQVTDILTHLFMHAAYHRGQIATAMRDAGGVPAYTDFIHAARTGALPAR